MKENLSIIKQKLKVVIKDKEAYRDCINKYEEIIRNECDFSVKKSILNLFVSEISKIIDTKPEIIPHLVYIYYYSYMDASEKDQDYVVLEKVLDFMKNNDVALSENLTSVDNLLLTHYENLPSLFGALTISKSDEVRERISLTFNFLKETLDKNDISISIIMCIITSYIKDTDNQEEILNKIDYILSLLKLKSYSDNTFNNGIQESEQLIYKPDESQDIRQFINNRKSKRYVNPNRSNNINWKDYDPDDDKQEEVITSTMFVLIGKKTLRLLFDLTLLDKDFDFQTIIKFIKEGFFDFEQLVILTEALKLINDEYVSRMLLQETEKFINEGNDSEEYLFLVNHLLSYGPKENSKYLVKINNEVKQNID